MKNLNIGIPAPIAIDDVLDDQVRAERTVSFRSWRDGTLAEDMGYAHIYSCDIISIEGVMHVVPSSLKITETAEDLMQIGNILFSREDECPFTDEMVPRTDIVTYNLCNHQFWFTSQHQTLFVNFFTKRKKH